jgi:hypothetical protein
MDSAELARLFLPLRERMISVQIEAMRPDGHATLHQGELHHALAAALDALLPTPKEPRGEIT